MSHPRLVKLVRDNVGQFLASNDKHTSVYYAPMESREEHRRQLRQKLMEETCEYLMEPSLGELADVYEVVAALAWIDLDRTMEEVKYEAALKRAERGGFANGIGMYCRTTAPSRHENG